MRSVLLYLGGHKGKSLRRIYGKFDVCYVFEANPEFVELLRKEYSRCPNVHVIHGALTSFDGETTFNISSGDGVGSSLGFFKGEWAEKRNAEMLMQIRVPAVNLFNFCVQNGIDHITEYISDLQGMDLAVLETMKPYIDSKKIRTITCEVTKDEYGNIYRDLPSNRKSDFVKLLSENYVQVTEGLGKTRDWCFFKTPSDCWEMDCKWRLKTDVAEVKPIVWRECKEGWKGLQLLKRFFKFLRYDLKPLLRRKLHAIP